MMGRFSPTFRLSWGVVSILGLHLKNDNSIDETNPDDASTAAFAQQVKYNRLNKQLEMFRYKFGIPGICFMVTANGHTYQTCIGHSDVENGVHCDNTAMRIASISKPLTSVAILKLWENGKIVLDKPIQEYVNSFPFKHYNGIPVTITTRQLLCHMGGIRNYDKILAKPLSDHSFGKYKEYYIKDHYQNVTESLELFQNDELIAKPGTRFHYTTYGYTLLSAIVEGASGMNFLQYMKEHIFRPLGMTATVPELNDVLIANRTRYYVRGKDGQLTNTPYVDNSYKWAGGGYLSTVEDLVSFGNALLLSYNEHQRRKKRGNNVKEEILQHSKYILEPSTVDMMWTVQTNSNSTKWQYSLGWMVCNNNDDDPLLVYHSGGAIGASSIIVIIPGPVSEKDTPSKPKGIVLAMLVNLQGVSDIEEIGKNIALQIYKAVNC